ncbi:MAG TPA: GNAT family N-acetyltransferase, partial [Niastella sp.]|nr:GNAT family N-acetyltransferase [Niastella sp.]
MHTIHKVDGLLRKKLEPMFSAHHRVDFGIDSILEGQSGKQISVTLDDVANPSVALLRYGTFGIFGGDAAHANAHALMQSIELPCAIQPSPEVWMILLQNNYTDKIKKIERFSFTHQFIDADDISRIIQQHPYFNNLHEISTATALAMENEEWHKYHLLNYDSAASFAANSFANGVTIDGILASVCSSALRCAKGIELNVITQPAFRKKGLAELVAAATVTAALEHDL